MTPQQVWDGSAWDAGVQNERTALAWDRSILGVAVVGLLVSREIAFRGAVPALAWIAVTAVMCVALHGLTRRRYLHVDSALRAGARASSGWLPVFLVAVVVAQGVTAIVASIT